MGVFGAVLSVFHEGRRVPVKGPTATFIGVLAVPLTIAGLWIAFYANVGQFGPAILFASVLYAIAFVTISASPRLTRHTPFDIAAAMLCLGCGAFLLWRAPSFETWVMGIDRLGTWDYVFGGAFIVLTLELLRRCLGVAFTVFVYLLIAYAFFGHLLPGTLAHPPMTLAYFVERMVVSQNTVGIFGQAMEIVASYAFLFVLMGKLFQTVGGGQFFFDVSAALAGRRVGGVAKVATVSSALFGSVSGSPTADIMTTGSITVPMMKKFGYPAKLAGAIEAVASTGGALLPPVMGAVAFLMAELTATSYAEVAKCAIVPALLYYLAVYAFVHLRSDQLGLGKMPEADIPSFGRAFRGGWMYLIPLAVLVGLLAKGYSADFVAASATVTTLALSWVPGAGQRIGPRQFVRDCIETCVTIAPMVSAVAAAGIVVGVLTLTGVTGKLAYVIFAATDQQLLPVLIVSMLITVLLGMGMPVVAVYTLVAVVVAPLIIKLGVSVLQTHLFLVYYAILSFITPPIAIAAYAAASLAEESPFAVGMEAMRVSVVVFLIPFGFAYDPSLMLIGSSGDIAFAVVSAVAGVCTLSAALVGWFRGPLAPWRRLVLLAAGVTLLVPTSLTLNAAAAAVAALIVVDRLLVRRLAAPVGAVTKGEGL